MPYRTVVKYERREKSGHNRREKVRPLVRGQAFLRSYVHREARARWRMSLDCLVWPVSAR